jgi:hypothetical protein
MTAYLTKETCVPGLLIRHNKFFVYVVLFCNIDGKITFYNSRGIYKHYLDFKLWEVLC